MAETSKEPIVIGLTGGIGTGKSNVLQTLVLLGAEGIDADHIARQIMEPDGPAYGAIVEAFGPEVLAPDGRIDRRRLGGWVFGDRAALTRLEAIVHPLVAEVVKVRAAASVAPVVVIEAIKLLEAGLGHTLCDQVWVTACSPNQQVARLVASRGMPAEEVRRRMAAQMPPKEMAARADRIIDTSGTVAETGLVVLGAWGELGLPFPRPDIRVGGADDAGGTAAVLNAIVQEGGLTVLDRVFTPAQERAFLRKLPQRSRLTIAEIGKVIAGFQITEPYVSYTRAMDHVACLGSYVVAPSRGRGLGRAMSELTFAWAREAGFTKVVVNVRADNQGAQAFYVALGFHSCGRLARQALVDGRYVDELLFEVFL